MENIGELLSTPDVQRLRAELGKCGGRPFFGILDKLQLKEEIGVPCQKVFLQLQELAWEKLHTGNWHAVSTAWRDAYSLACLLVAHTKLAIADDGSKPDAAESAAGVMRDMDMALMMGGPLFRPQVLHLVKTFNDQREGAQNKRQRTESAGAEGVESFPKKIPTVQDSKHSGCEELLSVVEQDGCNEVQSETSQQNFHQKRGTSSPSGSSLLGNVRGIDKTAAPRRYVEKANSDGADPELLVQPGCPRHQDASALPARSGTELQGAELNLPVGSMTKAENQLEAVNAPSLELFWTKYMQTQQPVVLKGCIDHWPAMRKWSDLSYLKRVAGNRTVPVEVGSHYLADGWGTKLMLLADFIDVNVSSPKEGPVVYLAQHALFDQIPELRKDICLPEFCSLGEGEVKAINAWFGPSGTVTPLHHDPHHNFLAQVVGKKYIRVYAPDAQMFPHLEGHNTNSSQVDLENVDETSFAGFSKMPYQECILSPGDALYMPPGFWHFVKSLDVSFSVTFWWS